MEDEHEYTRGFLDEMRAWLLAERDRLTKRQWETSDEILALKDSDDGIHDSIDITMLEETTSTMLKFRDRELLQIREINAALERLDKGEYGYCEETDEPIGEARLRANPLARFSVEAQEDLEKEEARRNFRPGLLDDME